MLDVILEFIKNSKEYKSWGEDWIATASTIGILFFTIIQGIGIKKQSNQIWKEQSGESLVETNFAFFLFYLIAFIVYGIRQGSPVMVINGLLFYFHIGLLRGLYKFKVIPKRNTRLIKSLPLIVVIMAILPSEALQPYLFTLLIVILVAMILQIRELYRVKHAGAINITYILLFLVSNMFWLVFAIIRIDWALIIFNIISIALSFWIIRLYKRYPKCNKQKNS